MTPDPRSGVTLIEMLVVVAIIGLMIAISFPSVDGRLDSVRMSSATGSVSAFLNSAVNRAERRQQPVALIDFGKGQPDRHVRQRARFERRLKLPDGISIQAVLPALDGETPDQPRQLILMPGGTAPAIGIMLANQHGIAPHRAPGPHDRLSARGKRAEQMKMQPMAAADSRCSN